VERIDGQTDPPADGQTAGEQLGGQENGEAPDLAILLEAMEAVVGEVSKVYQAVKRAVDSGDTTDYRRALSAFDGLPAWQRERILRVAMARAEEVAKPEEADAAGESR
jgi:hypothetical protein